MVVISVAVMLTGLLMPAMAQLHENAHRVVCMSNQSQIGQAFLMYGNDHNDNLPNSDVLHKDNAPQNLMVGRRGGDEGGFDGFGILFEQHYCDSAECFYCPSHHGDHPAERYADLWRNTLGTDVIYTNYQYAGDIDWTDTSRRRSLLEGHDLVLATDGLRTAADFNHKTGYNALRADGSVRWKEDTAGLYNSLPKSESDPIGPEYPDIWQLVGDDQ